MSELESTTSASPSPQPGSFEVVQAVWQLRVLVCVLGAMLFVVSLAFNLFIWKQNRDIMAGVNNRQRQLAQLEGRVKDLARVGNDFAIYSTNRPELIAIFSHYGLELKQSSPAPTAAKP